MRLWSTVSRTKHGMSDLRDCRLCSVVYPSVAQSLLTIASTPGADQPLVTLVQTLAADGLPSSPQSNISLCVCCDCPNVLWVPMTPFGLSFDRSYMAQVTLQQELVTTRNVTKINVRLPTNATGWELLYTSPFVVTLWPGPSLSHPVFLLLLLLDGGEV